MRNAKIAHFGQTTKHFCYLPSQNGRTAGVPKKKTFSQNFSQSERQMFLRTLVIIRQQHTEIMESLYDIQNAPQFAQVKEYPATQAKRIGFQPKNFNV